MPLQQADLRAQDLLRTLARHWRRGLLAATAVFGLAAAYAAVARPSWEASQSIVIRAEAFPGTDVPGKFNVEDEMKTVQETVLEIAHSPSVLRNVLRRVGPAADYRLSGEWPSAGAVDDLSSSIVLAPPKGAEFGKTEIVYLRTKDHQPERALALVNALFEELQTALGQLRLAVAQSTLSELEKSAAIADAELAESTSAMTALEQQAGEDLASLRMLHQSPNGESDLYRSLTAATDELRQNQVLQEQGIAMLQFLEQARHDPAVLLGSPRELLESNPTLGRLVQGLSEARLRTATLASKLSEAHPLLVAARHEEAQIRADIGGELGAAAQSLVASRELSAARIAFLEGRIAELRQRLDRLSDLRAIYSNLEFQLEQRRTQSEEAHRNLVQLRAVESAAADDSLLTRADQAQSAASPSGPSRASILLVGLAGGLLAGAGLIVLTAPVVRSPAGNAIPSDEDRDLDERGPYRPYPSRRTSRGEAGGIHTRSSVRVPVARR